MKILLNWSPLRQLFTYIQERFTFLVLLCWPAIIWLFCRVGVWLMDNVYELLGKSPAQSFTVYLQPFMTPGTLLRISISWIVLLFILFSMAMAFTWGLRRFYEPPQINPWAAVSRRPFLSPLRHLANSLTKTQQRDSKEHPADSQQG